MVSGNQGPTSTSVGRTGPQATATGSSTSGGISQSTSPDALTGADRQRYLDEQRAKAEAAAREESLHGGEGGTVNPNYANFLRQLSPIQVQGNAQWLADLQALNAGTLGQAGVNSAQAVGAGVGARSTARGQAGGLNLTSPEQAAVNMALAGKSGKITPARTDPETGITYYGGRQYDTPEGPAIDVMLRRNQD